MKNRLAHILHGNISVRVSNVTSAVGKALPIMQLAQDGLHLLSETKHDSSIVRRLQREAVCFSSRNEEKAQFVFGPESKGSCGIGLCAGPKVFGLCRLVQPPQDSPAALWFHQGRLALFAVTVRAAPRHRSDKGETVIYFFQLYGEVNNSPKAEELLKVVQAWALTLGSVPIFICGDFNLTYQESSVLQSWDRRCLFTDLNVHFSDLKQVEPQSTTTAGRRIDHVWANRKGLRIVKSFEVECDHFATHHTLKFDLDMKAFHQFGLLRHKPAPLDLRESGELNDQTLQAIRSFKQQHWHAAKSEATNLANSLEVRRAAMDAMLDIWSERAERFLVARSGGVWRRAMHQRGRVQPLKKSHVTLPCTRGNVDIHKAKDRYFRVQQAHNLQRRLRAVERMHFGAQRWQTWFKLEKDLWKLFLAAGINFTQEPHFDIPSPDLFTSLHSDICFLVNHFQGIAARKAKKQARDASHLCQVQVHS